MIMAYIFWAPQKESFTIAQDRKPKLLLESRVLARTGRREKWTHNCVTAYFWLILLL